ncbi:MAG: helix-turn-helix domain-containing protein [Limisphaerales bacterium]
MISNKQIIEGVREALSKAFKLWLEENRAEVIKLVAESVASTVKTPKVMPEQPKLSGQFFTAKQLAERWHLHPVSVLRMLRCGTLPCVWVGRRKLVPVNAVEEYEKGGSQQATL